LFCAVLSIAISLSALLCFWRALWRFFTVQSFSVAVKTEFFIFPLFILFAALFRPLSPSPSLRAPEARSSRRFFRGLFSAAFFHFL